MRAVLIYKGFPDREFTKDPGFVMHYLAGEGYTSEIWCAQQRGRKWFRPRIVSLGAPFFLKSLWRVFRRARSIDVLVLFHTRPLNPLYGMLYRLRNPRGVVYLKSDMDNTLLDLGKPSLLNYARRAKLLMNLRRVDVFSTEQEAVLALLMQRYPRYAHKMVHVPNGYGDYVKVRHRALGKKEPIILAVGPVGSRQKGTDLILKTLHLIARDLKGWKVILAGQVLDEYRRDVDRFLARHPALRGSIEFRGHVSSREEMLSLYDRARIIFMPSRWETFSCALVEAAAYGCVIVGTPVGGVAELTGKGAYGAVCPFEDPESYARELKRRMHDEELRLREAKLTQANLEKRFTWKAIAKGLAKRLKEERAKK